MSIFWPLPHFVRQRHLWGDIGCLWGVSTKVNLILYRMDNVPLSRPLKLTCIVRSSRR